MENLRVNLEAGVEQKAHSQCKARVLRKGGVRHSRKLYATILPPVDLALVIKGKLVNSSSWK